MNSSAPYALIDLASEELPILGSDGQRITEYRIPSVLTREQCVGKFHRGCPSKSLLPIFFTCLEAIAKPLIPGSPPVRKLGVFPGRDSGMVEWAVECAQLAGELVHGEPSRRLIFPGTQYGDALAAVMEEATSGDTSNQHFELNYSHSITESNRALPFLIINCSNSGMTSRPQP